jgi:DNA-binding ferritin-like protein
MKKNYNELVITFLCDLEGFKTRFKNLHWSAPQLTYHKIIDKLLDDLGDFQDTIAETSQGYLGKQFAVDMLHGTKISSTEGRDCLTKLTATVNDFHTAICDDKTKAGIVNAVNDFQQSLLKYEYLFPLAAKDGSSSFVSGGKQSSSHSPLSAMVE